MIIHVIHYLAISNTDLPLYSTTFKIYTWLQCSHKGLRTMYTHLLYNGLSVIYGVDCSCNSQSNVELTGPD